MKKLFTTGVLASMLILAVIAISEIPDAYAKNAQCKNTFFNDDITGNLVVPKNSWCVVEQSIIGGNLQVKEGAKADVFESVIQGNVVGPNPNAVYLSDSFVGGNVNVVGEVVIEESDIQKNVNSDGDDDILIWFSNIQGNINLLTKTTVEISQSETLGNSISILETLGSLISDVGVTLFDSILSGMLTVEKCADIDVSITNMEIGQSMDVKDNLGADPHATLVEDNTIGLDATCTGNTNLQGEPGSNAIGGTNTGCP